MDEQLPKVKSPAKKKPKWLRILETQSWQAELVISGMAIFGSLQLPELVDNLVNFSLYFFSSDYMDILYFVYIYLYFSCLILIISFITHLVLRSLWIGLLGLNSIYPNGVNPEFDMYGKDYMDKWLEEFPSLDEYNKRLDRTCSSIFAGAANAAMIMVSITLDLTILLLIATLINWLIPSLSLVSIMTFFIVLISIFAIGGMLLFTKKFRDKEWVKKIQYPIFRRLSKAMYLFAYEPINYIVMIFFSNATKKELFSTNNMIMLLSYILLIPILINSNMMLLMNDNYFRRNTNPNYIQQSAYENLVDGYIFKPIIQSDIIDEAAIRLFLPMPEREQSFADELCGTYQKNENLERRENNRAEDKFDIECASKYFEISLNGNVLSDLKFYKHNHVKNNESGFLTYIPTSICADFENILTIKSHLKNEEDGKLWETSIPFIFEGR